MLCWHAVEGPSWHCTSLRPSSDSALLHTMGSCWRRQKNPTPKQEVCVGDPGSCQLKRLASSMACNWCMFTVQEGSCGHRQAQPRTTQGHKPHPRPPPVATHPLLFILSHRHHAAHQQEVPETEPKAEPTAHHLAGRARPRTSKTGKTPQSHGSETQPEDGGRWSVSFAPTAHTARAACPNRSDVGPSRTPASATKRGHVLKTA